jgi:two-component system, NarL family, nitrate/nitrite response regulator NarL
MAHDPRAHGRVLIVDDDPSSRSFVANLLQQAGYVTEEAETGREALDVARRERPRLVVLEVCLHDVSGYEVCRELRDEFGEILPIIFMSGERVGVIDRSAGLLIGGDDYLVKPLVADELLARVRRLLSRAMQATVASGLTGRELEVLRFLAAGLSQKRIAEELVISPKTVGTHIERILRKLGVHSQSQAVALAYREGWVETPASRR